jgi:hypothetical protein
MYCVVLNKRHALQARDICETIVAEVQLGDARQDTGHIHVRQCIVRERGRLKSQAALQSLRQALVHSGCDGVVGATALSPPESMSDPVHEAQDPQSRPRWSIR